MKHIITKSAAEEKARKEYAEGADGIVEAGDELAAKVAELLELRHKMDEDELRKSQLMGEIMEEMKASTVLKDKSGRVIATWKPAVMKTKVDYKGLLKYLKASKGDFLMFSRQELGARTFELIEDQSECREMLEALEAK